MPQPESPQAQTLLEYLDVARRRWWIILLTALIAATASYLIARSSTPVYQAQAEVLLRGANASITQSTQSNTLTVATELRVISGFAVRQTVLKTLPNAVPISRAVSTSLNSFSVSTKSTDPQLAAASANAYVNAYIAQRRSDSLHDIQAVIDQLQAKVTDLQHQIDALGPPATTPAGVTRVLSAADVQRTALQNQQANYRIEMNDLQLQVGDVSGGALVLSPAGVPTSPVAPQPARTAAEAGGGGLILGLALAFLMEYLDNTVKTSEALARVSGDLPVLGLIPTVTGWRDRGQARVITRAAPSSPVSEAYRSLRTSLRFVGLDRPIRVMHVSSPASKDGKSTTVANLGVVLAQVGEKVVIVDLDLRRPRMHEFFQLSNQKGFTSVILGDLPLSQALQEVPGVPGLSVLTAGPTPTSPSEMLSSSRSASVVATLRDSGYTVLLDSPPLLPVSDALVVSTMADASVLVASAGLTKTDEIKRALELLHQVHAPLVGIVLNRAASGAHYSYGYSYPKDPKSDGPGSFQMRDDSGVINGNKSAVRPQKKVPAPHSRYKSHA